MTVTAQERLDRWLEQAYTMEKEAETLLDRQADRLEHYPLLRQRVVDHLDETRAQAEQLRTCLERRGRSTSTVQGMLGGLMGMVHAGGSALASDEVIKASVLGYAFEHMEIAAYQALILAAEAAGDAQTQAACTRILAQEQAIAAWLGTHLEGTVLQFLQCEQTEPEQANR